MAQLCFPRIWPVGFCSTGAYLQTDFLGGDLFTGGLIRERTLKLAISLRGTNFPVQKLHVFEAEQKCYVSKQSNFFITDLCSILY